jgi:uncharacterized protein
MLFALRKLETRGILALLALTVIYPVASGALRLAVITPEITAMLVANAKAFEISNNAAYGHGSFLQAAVEHTREFAASWGNRWRLWGELGWLVQMGQTMLLGLLAGRLRWPQRIPELMPQVRRWMWWLLAVGVLCGAGFTLIFATNRVPGPSPIKLLGGLLYWLSRPAMMLFYVLLVVRLSQLPQWQRRFAPLAAAGRMPLTNYLMQTLICTTLFYGWGFGLWGKVGPAAGFALSLAIFWGIQVPWSLWWLKNHQRGPLEALWARLTYGRSDKPALAAARP